MLRKRGWPVATELVILFTWLLKFSFAEVILFGTVTQNTNTFTFFTYLERPVHRSYSSSLDLLVINLQSCSFQIPILLAKPLATAINWYVTTYLATSPSKKNQQVLSRRISTSPQTRDVPEKSYSATLSTSRLHLPIVETHLETRSRFSLSLSTYHREFLIGHKGRLGEIR